MADLGTSSVVGRELFLASLITDGRRLADVMHRFALRTEEMTCEVGEALYRAGEVSEHFFFVVAGEVTLTRPGAADSLMGAREVLGTIDALLTRAHTHTATATQPTQLLRIHISDWAETLEDHFDVAAHIVAQISRRVRLLRVRPPPLGGFEEEEPASSRGTSDLHVVDRILHLRAVPLFARASTQALAALAQVGSTTFAGAGEVLFGAGETRGYIVVVAFGEVSMAWPGSPEAPRFRESSLLGGGSSLCNEPMAEVRAVSAARAIVLPREDYFDVMEEHFDLARSTLAALSEERQALLDRGT